MQIHIVACTGWSKFLHRAKNGTQMNVCSVISTELYVRYSMYI
jgi:hypothetical protein